VTLSEVHSSEGDDEFINDWQSDGKDLLSIQGASTLLRRHQKWEMMGGEGRNVLQPPNVSLICGLWRNSMQLHLPVQLMHTPWHVPAPHSLCQWANWSVRQLLTEHHNCSPSTPRLWSVHSRAHPLKNPGLSREWPGDSSCLDWRFRLH